MESDVTFVLDCRHLDGLIGFLVNRLVAHLDVAHWFGFVWYFGLLLYRATWVGADFDHGLADLFY